MCVSFFLDKSISISSIWKISVSSKIWFWKKSFVALSISCKIDDEKIDQSISNFNGCTQGSFAHYRIFKLVKTYLKTAYQNQIKVQRESYLPWV